MNAPLNHEGNTFELAALAARDRSPRGVAVARGLALDRRPRILMLARYYAEAKCLCAPKAAKSQPVFAVVMVDPP